MNDTKMSDALNADVVWLWTHCRALGMTRRSDSGLMRDDIALFVVDLHTKCHASAHQAVKKKQTKKEHDALVGVIEGWDSLEGGRSYRPKEIEEWLRGPMVDAINSARRVLSSKGNQ